MKRKMNGLITRSILAYPTIQMPDRIMIALAIMIVRNSRWCSATGVLDSFLIRLTRRTRKYPIGIVRVVGKIQEAMRKLVQIVLKIHNPALTSSSITISLGQMNHNADCSNNLAQAYVQSLEIQRWTECVVNENCPSSSLLVGLEGVEVLGFCSRKSRN